ncbi:MAG: methyltransferase [Bacteroidales bacterium]|nr:methyltransferase [Bacteroidales bacterium]
MGIFRFKRFNVVNERSAMKVNTDGVLLGAAMTLRPSDRRLLDIGTGTGTIALMAAQRLTDAVLDHTDERSISLDSCGATRMVQDGPEGQTGSNAGTDERSIDAVDIDEASAVEAAENFRNSPWNRLLRAFNMSLDQYDGTFSDNRYDLIFSNPPYFEDSLNAPEERRNNARHTSTGLSYREILDFASERLSEDGRVSVVLPAEAEAPLCRHARMNGLHLFRIIRVRTVPRKAPSRIIAEFSRLRTENVEDIVLTIQNEGKYTQEYLSLTRDFYLFA